MANWIKMPCLELIKKLNDVPFDDDREEKQLTILMSGISNVTREMMSRAASNVRKELGPSDEVGHVESAPNVHIPKKKPAKSALPEREFVESDTLDDELDMIEQTLIRSIGD